MDDVIILKYNSYIESAEQTNQISNYLAGSG